MAPGNWEIMLIVLVFLLLFGATAIPKLARSLGKAKGEFQQAKGQFESEMAKGESSASTDSDMEARIRQTARDLEIPEAGRPIEDVKADLNDKLS